MVSLVEDSHPCLPDISQATSFAPERILQLRSVRTLGGKDGGTQEVTCRCARRPQCAASSKDEKQRAHCLWWRTFECCLVELEFEVHATDPWVFLLRESSTGKHVGRAHPDEMLVIPVRDPHHSTPTYVVRCLSQHLARELKTSLGTADIKNFRAESDCSFSFGAVLWAPAKRRC